MVLCHNQMHLANTHQYLDDLILLSFGEKNHTRQGLLFYKMVSINLLKPPLTMHHPSDQCIATSSRVQAARQVTRRGKCIPTMYNHLIHQLVLSFQADVDFHSSYPWVV